MDIAVIGRGIGGLAAAALLTDIGHDVSMFDASETPRASGAGMILPPPAQSVLARLGLIAEISPAAAQIREVRGESSDGALARSILFDRLGEGSVGLAVHRSVIFEALNRSVVARGVPTHGGSLVLDAVNEKSGAILRLERAAQDGPFDMVVDASGSTSALSRIQRRNMPFGTLWCTVDLGEEADVGPVLRQRFSDGKMSAGILPLGRPHPDAAPRVGLSWTMTRAAYREWQSMDIEDWKAEAEAFWPEFGYFAQGISCHEELAYVPHRKGAILKPWRKRMVHIGDAASLGTPGFGLGGQHALLDAAALADAVDKASSVREAMIRFTAARLANRTISRINAQVAEPFYHSRWHVLPKMRQHIMAPVMARQMGWVATRLALGTPFAPSRHRDVSGETTRMPLHGPGE